MLTAGNGCGKHAMQLPRRVSEMEMLEIWVWKMKRARRGGEEEEGL